MTSVDAWVEALVARHVTPLGRPEFLKALRALSVRYVEQRAALGHRSPIDSAGKRAAFAAFYGPLHFLTVDGIVRALGADRLAVETIVDLGCGTGSSSAAWARAIEPHPAILGVDRHPWAVAEARWTWATLGVVGRARQEDLIRAATDRVHGRPAKPGTASAILCGWSVNELADDHRAALLPILLEAAHRGAAVLVVEPLARRATPWWPAWQRAVEQAGGRADEWRFDVELPARLADLDEAAGFRREGLSARSLFLGRPAA